MRTETTTRNLYTYEELSDKAKEKALINLADINVDYEWWDTVYEDAKTIGLEITSFYLGGRRDIEGHFILSAHEVAQNILNDHGDTCETYKTATAFMEKHEPVYASYLDESSEAYESPESEDKLLKIENKFLHDLLEDYLVMLDKEYEWLTSDESILETIEANEYEFTEDGALA